MSGSGSLAPINVTRGRYPDAEFAFMQAKNETLSDFLEIGKRIRRLREHYRLTGKRLAEILDLQPVTLSRYENGRPIPSDVLARLCAEYPAVSGDWLLTGRGDMMRSEAAPAVVKVEAYFADTRAEEKRAVAKFRLTGAKSTPPPVDFSAKPRQKRAP